MAECHPAGMEGVGAVQLLYRVGVLRDDDEVAVATEPDHGHRAVSLALVNVRFAVLGGLRRGLLDRDRAAALLTAAKARHFSERHWPGVFADAGVPPSAELRALCLGYDVKRRDAVRAVASLSQTPALRRVPAPKPPSAVRYPGDDPYFGWAPDTLAQELTAWLAASGRYRRYWPAPRDPETTWSELGDRRERDHELMRWHAVRRGVELAGSDVGDGDLGAARALVAQAHGYSDWRALCADSAMGCLPCGVSVGQVSDAARQLARAARGLGCAPEASGSRPDYTPPFGGSEVPMPSDDLSGGTGSAQRGRRLTLPTGVVTLVFTDVEGSTALLRRLGPRYAELLDPHNEIVTSSVIERGGTVIRGEGDAFSAPLWIPRGPSRRAWRPSCACLTTYGPRTGSSGSASVSTPARSSSGARTMSAWPCTRPHAWARRPTEGR